MSSVEQEIEQYRQQRVAREAKRLEFVRRFEAVKAKLAHQVGRPAQEHIETKQKPKASPVLAHQTVPAQKPAQHAVKVQQVASESTNDEETRLQQENVALLKQIEEQEQAATEKMTVLKSQIGVLKDTYMKEMEEITRISQTEKGSTEKKLKELITSIKQAQKKNLEIAEVNKTLKEEALASEEVINGYVQEMKQEYEEKLGDFAKILLESKQRVEQLEKNFNEEEMVAAALANKSLMDALLSSSVSDETTKEEYQAILESKTNIIKELMNNSSMKETEIKKIKELIEKFKKVFETLNAEKKELVEDNEKMTKELLDIKKIFERALGQSDGNIAEDDGEDEDQEEQEEQEEEEEQEEVAAK